MISWNVENLSYENSKNNISNDSVSKFNAKLENISNAISTLYRWSHPDIIMLQEIEGKKTLEKLRTAIEKKTFSKYPYYFLENSNMAQKNAVLSTYPMLYKKNHLSAGKYIQEFQVFPGKHRLIIFNVHLKAMSGSDNIEKRRESAKFLISRIHELEDKLGKNIEFFIGGDFNSDVDRKGDLFGEGGMLIRSIQSFDGKDNDRLYYECDRKVGTYYYSGKNECLDYFLLNFNLMQDGGFKLKKMGVFNEDFLLYNSKIPKRFNKKTGEGYSDHLPIFLELTLQ